MSTLLHAGLGLSLTALLALPGLAVDEDGSTGSINVGSPKKDGSMSVSIGYKFLNDSGNLQNETLAGVSIDVNGKPKAGGNDDPQTTAGEKAQLLANAINDAAEGDDGEPNTGDEHPLHATAIGDTVVVQNTDTGGTIEDLDTDTDTNERDKVQVDATSVTDIVLGEFTLIGIPSAASTDPGQPAFVTVLVDAHTFTHATAPGDTVRLILNDLVTQMNAAGLSASRSGNRITVTDPIDHQIDSMGSEVNDRTLSNRTAARKL